VKQRHFSWNVVVYNNKVNLIGHQRSGDFMIGVPFNIASLWIITFASVEPTGYEPQPPIKLRVTV
tara:strand:+ start:4158 stop:4352 length:195 start_codon:yes stop_codon:yes gene_type:complete